MVKDKCFQSNVTLKCWIWKKKEHNDITGNGTNPKSSKSTQDTNPQESLIVYAKMISYFYKLCLNIVNIYIILKDETVFHTRLLCVENVKQAIIPF